MKRNPNAPRVFTQRDRAVSRRCTRAPTSSLRGKSGPRIARVEERQAPPQGVIATIFNSRRLHKGRLRDGSGEVPIKSNPLSALTRDRLSDCRYPAPLSLECPDSGSSFQTAIIRPPLGHSLPRHVAVVEHQDSRQLLPHGKLHAPLRAIIVFGGGALRQLQSS